MRNVCLLNLRSIRAWPTAFEEVYLVSRARKAQEWGSTHCWPASHLLTGKPFWKVGASVVWIEVITIFLRYNCFSNKINKCFRYYVLFRGWLISNSFLSIFSMSTDVRTNMTFNEGNSNIPKGLQIPQLVHTMFRFIVCRIGFKIYQVIFSY